MLLTVPLWVREFQNRLKQALEAVAPEPPSWDAPVLTLDLTTRLEPSRLVAAEIAVTGTEDERKAAIMHLYLGTDPPPADGREFKSAQIFVQTNKEHTFIRACFGKDTPWADLPFRPAAPPLDLELYVRLTHELPIIGIICETPFMQAVFDPKPVRTCRFITHSIYDVIVFLRASFGNEESAFVRQMHHLAQAIADHCSNFGFSTRYFNTEAPYALSVLVAFSMTILKMLHSALWTCYRFPPAALYDSEETWKILHTSKTVDFETAVKHGALPLLERHVAENRNAVAEDLADLTVPAVIAVGDIEFPIHTRVLDVPPLRDILLLKETELPVAIAPSFTLRDLYAVMTIYERGAWKEKLKETLAPVFPPME